VLCEIGGTVGDIEGLPFFEAIRQLGNELPRNHGIYIHLRCCRSSSPAPASSRPSRPSTP